MMERATLDDAWQALPKQRRKALLNDDRVGLIRWMKRLLKAQRPQMDDAAATVAAVQMATEMFGV